MQLQRPKKGYELKAEVKELKGKDINHYSQYNMGQFKSREA
jgi:hypothetical protein